MSYMIRYHGRARVADFDLLTVIEYVRPIHRTFVLILGDTLICWWCHWLISTVLMFWLRCLGWFLDSS